MLPFITLAGLAFANLATAGPCKPVRQTTVSSIESDSTTFSSVNSVSTTVSFIESVSSTISSVESASTTISVKSASSTIVSIESASTVSSAGSASSAISSIESVSSTALSVEDFSTTVSSAESASSTAPVATVITTSTNYPVPAISQSSDSSAVVISETSSEATTLSTVIVQDTTTTEASTTEAATSSTDIETSSGTAILTSETVLPTADQSCDNGGLDYAIYEHTFYNADPPHFSSFDATFFHDATPTYTGFTERIGIQPGTDWTKPFTIYEGSPSQKFQYKAVNHHGFLYAPETGTYEVTVPNSDEITLVWFGDKALSSWTRENADLEQDYPGGTSKSFQIDLEAGTYTPFRLLWANAQGELNFIAEVQAPGGKIIVNGDRADNKYLVREACDKSTPTFPSF
ncbi:hypothetical protein KAF25_003882 [Fusarium avenaceum]|uniref:PA14 domain-containing protein n=1 Tax=Fusarium avenaceum TaxID=40199 RepID=A0A9P7KP41_9HYPO|nr:hypothetical protein KAF25_003882 [Fusarium avenaceum]